MAHYHRHTLCPCRRRIGLMAALWSFFLIAQKESEPRGLRLCLRALEREIKSTHRTITTGTHRTVYADVSVLLLSPLIGIGVEQRHKQGSPQGREANSVH